MAASFAVRSEKRCTGTSCIGFAPKASPVMNTPKNDHGCSSIFLIYGNLGLRDVSSTNRRRKKKGISRPISTERCRPSWPPWTVAALNDRCSARSPSARNGSSPFLRCTPPIPGCSSIYKSSMTRVSKGSKCTPTTSQRNAESKAACFRRVAVILQPSDSTHPTTTPLVAALRFDTNKFFA